jgi:hypothetical protein
MRYDVGRFRRPMRRSTEGQLMSLISLGDGSTLSLDFTTGVIDPRLTFTRSGTATFINASGVVATASTNTPRFDHDPTTGSPRGLLIEGTATNLLNWSESFATSGGTNNNWADTNITRNSTNNTDPANGTTALRVTASAGNGTIISTAAIGTSAQRTFSIWLRRVSGTGDIQYTLNNGSTYTTQAITSSWVRYTFAATTADQRVGIRIVTSGDSIELWGAQLEAGSGASSYIPTGASQGTRNADNCVMTGTNFSSWYNQGEGTFLMHCQLNRVGASHLLNVNVNNAAPRLMITEASNQFNAASENPSGTNFNLALGSSSTSAAKIITAFKSLDTAGTRNGGTVQTSATLTIPTTVNLLRIGSAEGGYQYMVGTVSLLKYWPTRLPNAQLQSLTT